MTYPRKHNAGFTLIELLTVIAIIGILAGFVLTGLPRMLARAQVTDARNSMKQLETALETYYGEHESYPPAYGYLDIIAKTELDRDDRENYLIPNQVDNDFDDRDSCRDDPCYTDRYYVSRHFMDFLRNFSDEALYDRFSEAPGTNDTDFERYISRLEYVPRNGVDRTIVDYSSSPRAGKRPFIYVPVNMRQFKNVARQWIKDWKANPNSLGPRPDITGPNSVLQNMQFPPPRYDAYVLISMSPGENTRGLVYDIIGNQTALTTGNYNVPNYYYHIAGLATFFMATRDLNVIDIGNGLVGGDGSLDFEFSSRIADAQDDYESNYYPVEGPGVDAPIIYISSGFSRSFENGLVDE